MQKKTISELLGEMRIAMSIKREEEIKKIIKKELKNTNEELLSLLYLFYATHETSGKLYQKDIFLYNRGEKLKKEIENVLEKEHALLTGILAKELNDLVIDEYNYQRYSYEIAGKSKKPYKPLSPKALEEINLEQWYGENYKKTLKNDPKILSNNLYKSLVVGAGSQGMTKSGVTHTAKVFNKSLLNRQNLLVETEISRKKSRAVLAAIENAGIEEERFLWLATFDTRTCETCASYDGKTYRKKDLPNLPVHPRCRCDITPVFFNEPNVIKRARRDDGKTYLTNQEDYHAWLKEYKQEIPVIPIPSGYITVIEEKF